MSRTSYGNRTGRSNSTYNQVFGRPRRFDSDRFLIGGIITLFILVVVCVLGFHVAQATAVSTQTCKVVDKDFAQASDGDGGSHGVYRIATQQCGVLEVRDNLAHGKFNSADTYYSIQKGKTYEFTTTGYRIPLFSAFPGIISATEVAS
jgi:hypothetical protein